MSYLLDTNVISEIRKPARRANPEVRAWLADQAPLDLYVSVISIMEIEIGIGRLRRHDRAQASRLDAWLNHGLLEEFAGRILPIDLTVARWAAQAHVPDPRPERDTFIGATAAVHGLTVATRNVKDFVPLGLPFVNPWMPTGQQST
ncbi:type II toxin-antitoxin system VapC family toxin [Propionimicrobium sp. PCR01-08-3]|uniref:type II toxin-antitoxin system VapC family toxin n=1 Tax=Propionimicrobium sp. PCR01-08-3 TaxID=3052086 RepID=UPI00255CC6F7|nr:type II toxin-antitoxin system VapC family toxin [Propionimicrobium sp. PCR01-08-3]WIY83036.1 type II toxin-antitoxin system VapC family toxin [Propionimicrobium sp. PCR01-08-3]